MALLFMDGFDHYTTNAQLNAKWDGVQASVVINQGTGRNGGNCVDLLNSNPYYLQKVIGGVGEMILGFAMKPTVEGVKRDIIYLYNTQGFLQAYISRTIANTLEFRDGSGAVYGTGSVIIPNGVWTYVEIRFKPDAVSGVIQTRINGVLDFDFSGDTKYSTYTDDIDLVKFVMQFQAAEIDDVYICDATGATNNSFLGDVVVGCVYPDGDSANDFTATGAGTTNADRVSETSPDGDTTYVSATTVANQERYTYGAVPVDVGTIFGVQTVPYVKKSNISGSRTIRSLAYSVATEAVGDAIGVGGSYGYLPQIFEQDPDAAAAWTPATLNAASFGIEIVT